MKQSSNDNQRKKGDNFISTELPMGFSNALLKNAAAMSYFNTLDEGQKSNIINQTHQISSKSQMQQFVDSLQPSL